MFEELVTVSGNRRLTRSFYLLGLKSRRMARAARPGHFLQLRVGDGIDPFLPRPMSIYKVRGDDLLILYIVVGKGTSLLAQLRAGSRLGAWGPLGSTFRVPRGREVLLVGGGVGIAPLVFWATRAPAARLFFGVRTKHDRLSARELALNTSRVRYATDDGSLGHNGYVTDLFDAWARAADPRRWFVLTCGPDPMLRKVVARARRHGIAGQASLEETMACGVGACLGCVRFVGGSQRTVCRDGPVFDFGQLE